ncbi:MAG TPA: glycosyltransferase [Solirubrobacteraceae bacterium]|nr:glycosyltransferase [Solirubrobacteraceae bacterium]
MAPSGGSTAPGTTADARSTARVGVIGISIDDPCGVRDHAALLADALTAGGVECSLNWLDRTAAPLGVERAEVRDWTDAIDRELAASRAAAVLLHYSVFAFAHRGVPVFAKPVLAAIGRSRLPLVTFMHEYAYPWRLGGARGKVWAATQRFVLREVVSASTALVVSADARAASLRSRAWLPRRPVAVAPVFSNLPSPGTPARPRGVVRRLGLFGYGHEGVDFATVLDALGELRERAGEVELTLLGAPGSPSPAAERWRREAAARGLADAIGFSGRLPAQRLADALAGCDVLLFAERGGATSRKTTLAASLSSGRPVVALDGANSWPELSRARAAVIVEPRAQALAGAIATLLADRDLRARQGELGRGFAARAMSVEHSASVVGAALRSAIG